MHRVVLLQALVALISYVISENVRLTWQDIQCDKNADCPIKAHCNSMDHFCYCDSGFHPSHDQTECSRTIGDSCISSFECGQNAFCKNQTCSCEENYYPSVGGVDCVRNKTLGVYCRSNSTLWLECGQNTRCIDNKCTCSSGYIPEENLVDCSPYRQLLGYACSNETQCGVGTVCVQVTQPLPEQWTKGPACNCKPYFRESENGIDCLSDPEHQCKYDYQCPIHSWCGFQDKCVCDANYEVNGQGCQPVNYSKALFIGIVGGIVGSVLLAFGIIFLGRYLKRRQQTTVNESVTYLSQNATNK